MKKQQEIQGKEDEEEVHRDEGGYEDAAGEGTAAESRADADGEAEADDLNVEEDEDEDKDEVEEKWRRSCELAARGKPKAIAPGGTGCLEREEER